MTCVSSNNSALPIGLTGSAGAQGLFGGFSGRWYFSTLLTNSNTATKLKFNNATPSSVTEIYVSTSNYDGLDYGAFLASFSNSSDFGYIRIFKESDSTKFWVAKVTSVTSSGGGTYYALGVTYIDANDSFALDEAVVLTFSPGGSTGSDVLYNDITDTAVTSATFAALKSYTIPAGTLTTEGSYLDVVGVFTSGAGNDGYGTKLEFRINSSTTHSKATEFLFSKNSEYGRILIRISRMSSTTVFLDFRFVGSSTLTYDSGASASFFETGFTVSDLDSLTNVIEFRAKYTSGTSTVALTQHQLQVTYYKK